MWIAPGRGGACGTSFGAVSRRVSHPPTSSRRRGRPSGRSRAQAGTHAPQNSSTCRFRAHAAAAEPSCLPSEPRASSQVHGSRPCMGRLLSRGVTPSFFSFFLRGAFFCSTRAASILPSRPQFPWPSRAGAVKDGAKRHPKGLSLTAPSTAARWRRSGRAAMTFDPRGACEGRATRRRPHLYSVGPLRDPDHEAGIRFACKAPRRRVHSGRGT